MPRRLGSPDRRSAPRRRRQMRQVLHTATSAPTCAGDAQLQADLPEPTTTSLRALGERSACVEEITARRNAARELDASGRSQAAGARTARAAARRPRRRPQSAVHDGPHTLHDCTGLAQQGADAGRELGEDAILQRGCAPGDARRLHPMPRGESGVPQARSYSSPRGSGPWSGGRRCEAGAALRSFNQRSGRRAGGGGSPRRSGGRRDPSSVCYCS